MYQDFRVLIGCYSRLLALEGRNFYEGHTDSVQCLRVWGNHLLTGAADGSIRKFELQVRGGSGSFGVFYSIELFITTIHV